MLKILSSPAATASHSFELAARRDGEDNTRWLARYLTEPEVGLRRPLTTTDEGEARQREPTLLVLLGSRGHLPFRLRVAQSHLRHDLTPSYWSHAALLGPIDGGDLAGTPLYEISLEPPTGFAMPTATNGLQIGRLDTYADTERHPNIAVLRVPVAAQEWQTPTTQGQISVLERYQKQRSVLDATELLLDWLGFVWGVNRAVNPLLDGHGIPSAAMIEAVVNASGFDLTPSLESRASCPEAIWQSAKWWHPFYGGQNTEPLEGFFTTPHRIQP